MRPKTVGVGLTRKGASGWTIKDYASFEHVGSDLGLRQVSALDKHAFSSAPAPMPRTRAPADCARHINPGVVPGFALP